MRGGVEVSTEETKRKIEVTTEISIPNDVSDEEIDAWVSFDIGQNGSIKTAVLDKFTQAEIVDWKWREAGDGN